MKRILTLLLALVLCTSCAALPAEERAFAVVLAISGREGAWELHARIPTYQAGGGYATVAGAGDTLSHALAALDAAAPMPLHLGQLRLAVVAQETAASQDFADVLAWFGEQVDIRPGAVLCVTESDASALMEALKPAAGTRLSKALDALLEARIGQGVIPASALAEVLTAGERQSPVLAGLALEGEDIVLSGGWPVGADGRVAPALTAQETQLLTLMQGQWRQGTLTLPEGTLRLTGATAAVELSLPALDQASLRLTLQLADNPPDREALSQAIATACLTLLSRLSALGCDALGLARQAIPHMDDMAQWQALDWPGVCRRMAWSVSVGVEPAAT
ncbi:MAG: hypothetical protein IJE07_06465 [Clostridia bacterium]|nr:hypothetical protein [Clostridia bacterium]